MIFSVGYTIAGVILLAFLLSLLVLTVFVANYVYSRRNLTIGGRRRKEEEHSFFRK